MQPPLGSVAIHRGTAANFALDAIRAAQGLSIGVYVDDAARSATIGVVPVMPFATWCEHTRTMPSIVTAREAGERRTLTDRIQRAGYRLASLAVVGDAVSPQTTFGEGTLVDVGALYVGSLTTVGRLTIVMTPASLGHDVMIGNFVMIFPSAAISGYVVIEDDVTIGVGAVISNGRPDRPLRIGRGARVASGAVVVGSVRPGVVVPGNRARAVSV